MGSISKQCQAIRLALQKLGAQGIQKQTLSVKEVAARLRLTQAEVRRMIAIGVLRWTLVGREQRIPRHLVDRLRPR